jgi:hypothetical protein
MLTQQALCHNIGPPYLGSASRALTGITHLPYFPIVGFAQGNNNIGVLNIESLAHARQSESGVVAPPRKHKYEYNILRQEVY